MPLVPDFTIEQLSNLSSVNVEDTSTGSDGAIASRRVYFQLYNGTYLVPTGTTTDYVPFPLSSGAEIQIDALLYRDYSINVTVQWLNGGNSVLYTKTLLRGFAAYGRYALYQFTQYQISNNKLLYNSNYRNSKLDMWQAILSGDNAVTYGSDITNAQACYDAAKYYIDNPQLFH